MFTSIIDHPWWVYLFFGVVALGLLIGLWTTRKREFLYGLALVAVLGLLAGLLLYLATTDQKQIIAAINDMGAGVRARDPNRIFANISTQFRLGTLDKEGFRRFVDPVVRSGDVSDVETWEYEDAVISRPSRRATINFKVKPKGRLSGDAAYYLCKSTFVLDLDDHWRLQGFQVFNPFVDSDKPMDVQQYIH